MGQGRRAGCGSEMCRRASGQAAVLHKVVRTGRDGSKDVKEVGTILSGSPWKEVLHSGEQPDKAERCLAVQEAEKANVCWSRVSQGRVAGGGRQRTPEGHPYWARGSLGQLQKH